MTPQEMFDEIVRRDLAKEFVQVLDTLQSNWSPLGYQGEETISFIDATRAMEKAIADKGEDYVYPKYRSGEGCVYFDRVIIETNPHKTRDPVTMDEVEIQCPVVVGVEIPSCAVGHIVDILGYTEKFMESSNSHGVNELFKEWGAVGVDAQTAAYMSALQNLQDIGTPWQTAHEVALLTAEFVMDNPERLAIARLNKSLCDYVRTSTV